MSNNSKYWYSSTGNSITSELPAQAISSNKKTKKWREANLDALERIGLRQLQKNLKYKDFYRMVEGKYSYKEISEVIPQLREVGSMLEDMDIPTYIKHYDLIGIIVNAMIGDYLQSGDKFSVTNIDKFSSNEYERDKTELVRKHIQEQFQKELNRRLLQRGINPDPSKIKFNSEEEKQGYLQELDAIKKELTPKEIEDFMQKSWRTWATIWGENSLEADRERFYLDELDREELKDYLLTGRCFRHFRVGYDSYKPERWSPITTFISEDLDTKYCQDGDYVGRIHFMTPNQIVNSFGYMMSATQKKQYLKSDYRTGEDYGNHNAMGAMKKHFGETHLVPHKNYYDYQFMLDIQEEYGVPMGTRTFLDKDKSEVQAPVFMPDYNGRQSYQSLANSLRTEDSLRTDLRRVTEAYWVSYKKVGYINFITESGRPAQKIVTDDLLPEFLQDNDIKQINSMSLKELDENPKQNAVVWDYIPKVWKGIKVSEGTTDSCKAMYLGIEEMEMQLKGDSNIYDVKLPVAGLIRESLANKIEPFQTGHNVAMNQTYNLIEKEIGLFFIFDINFLPSEFKEWGDTEESLIHLRNLTKDLGFFPVDSSKQNLRGGGSFNQMTATDMSFSSQIASRIQLADFYRNKAFEQIGFNQQRLGTPVKYETAEGVRQSQSASYAQTEVYYENFSSYKRRMLELHLNVAQYCQKSNKDITVFYRNGDDINTFQKFTDKHFHLRRLGILPIDNSKKRKERAQLKSILMQNNTIGTDEMALAELLTSDSMVEMISVSRKARVKREKAVQEGREHERQMLEAQAKAQKENLVFEWKLREEYAKNRDIADIEQERVEAIGRAADSNADSSHLEYISDQADLALRTIQIQNKHEIDSREVTRKTNKDTFDKEYKLKQLEAQLAKTNATLERSRNDKYIAEINT